MSVLKELRSKPENIINIVDMLSLICFDGKSKYVETLLRIMRETEGISDYKAVVVSRMVNDYQINSTNLKKYDTLQLIYMDNFFKDMFELEDLNNFKKFCELNERNLIDENDVSRYNSFSQINNAVNIAELKVTEKEMEKQIIKIYETDEWLILKPLTFESSKKYGSHTKWCTTSEGNDYHFNSYAKGILIYSINKKTNYKVACYKDLATNEISFWNQLDQKVDSLDTDLSIEVLKIIKDDIKNCKSSNLSFYKGETKPKKRSIFDPSMSERTF